ncbi:DUF732 domain-containing protein [Mycolicibacter sinensis]|uniref:DUF732 domain-containing protein n=1 Tax=Mycolicibacter sinensis (strain JDM601) TaxID=875328 RepID=A0A1A2NWK3_MYCSD|nr:DUF732 domain-containing protein [Mycolicibacter sinensis]OBH19452.1 hypothetical protein A5694_18835 [Mycolicibacter sinensis]OBI31137.1 hypothetical protein A5710_18715 [Mycolicibacter sinensis]
MPVRFGYPVAAVLLSGAAALPAIGPAAAAPSQDERFLSLLARQQPVAMADAPELVAAAHRVCDLLDGGMSFKDLVHQLGTTPPDAGAAAPEIPTRSTSSIVRFVAAAAAVYCPLGHDGGTA